MKQKKKTKHLTLKEAAKISGYSPDYIGQLIRQGKLPGKQIYTNVAWVTTEEDVLNYLEKAQKGRNQHTPLDKAKHTKRRVFLESNFNNTLKGALYFSIGMLTAFVLALFYIFSVTLDGKIEQRAKDTIEIAPYEAQITGNNAL